MAALLNTERGVTGRKLNFHLLQTVPLLCSAPVGPETMTQRIQEAQHHKSRWLVVSCHVTHSFPLYNICGRRCENPTLQKGKAGQVQHPPTALQVAKSSDHCRPAYHLASPLLPSILLLSRL